MFPIVYEEGFLNHSFVRDRETVSLLLYYTQTIDKSSPFSTLHSNRQANRYTAPPPQNLVSPNLLSMNSVKTITASTSVLRIILDRLQDLKEQIKFATFVVAPDRLSPVQFLIRSGLDGSLKT